ncbi:NAC (No Apical Meristem) domain transcriptionalregulator superfamily protein [Striga asiatica]|uniref:NAC (No Apical Meristem) domain transcriptionalregulator superfamily protein n=1 Tax=Striga asiatica TaxID=4170 RepID=A0A5A7QKL8_STRAF|nr:NAC (No Apical Meristem) domain transcriptionalregulator superfamily protein [Striga asiatica]
MTSTGGSSFASGRTAVSSGDAAVRSRTLAAGGGVSGGYGGLWSGLRLLAAAPSGSGLHWSGSVRFCCVWSPSPFASAAPWVDVARAFCGCSSQLWSVSCSRRIIWGSASMRLFLVVQKVCPLGG